jgi:TolB protein
MQMHIIRAVGLFMCGLLGLATLAPSTPRPASAQTVAGTIAYTRDNDTTGDEIRLIEPDGSNDRRIWSVGQSDPNNIVDITDLDWSPDAGTLAFASNHEALGAVSCSLFESDIFAIWPDGTGYRRITNAPTCASLARFPQGSVTVTVRNFSTRSPLFVYIQGAPSIQSILVSQGGSATVTFPDVADFGDGFLQQAVVIAGDGRWLAPIAAADVKPGQTVHAGRIDVAGAPIVNFGAYVPSWHSDGSRLGYVLISAGSMYRVPSNPVAGDYGEPLLNLDPSSPPSSDVMDWGPAPARVNQILYSSYLNGGIYLVTEDSNTVGTKLVETGIEGVVDLQWLPDGSGFLFTKQNFIDRSNVYRYDFAGGGVTQLTQFTNEFAIDLSASPDGEWIVFERAATNDLSAGDLWIMRRDGADLRLLVQNGMRPSWSQRAPQLPKKDYIPLMQR